MRSMKDSGIPWIGDIPVNWSVNKIKYNLHREEPRNPGNMPVLSLYREYGVIPKDSRDDNHNVTSEDTSKYKHVRLGDFVINKMKAWQGSVAVSRYEGIVSPAYFVYRFDNQNVRREYFNYLIRACYKDEFRRLSGGIREGQWDLPSEALDNTPILLPPIDEQRHIANFLDEKCAEIDALTADVQKEIETLQEYRRSLITEAVTKGLNPNTEMKRALSFNVLIPKHWSIVALKYLLRKMRNGYVGPTKDILTNEGVRYIQSLHVKDGRINYPNDFFVLKSWGMQHPKIHTNDLLIVQTGDIGQVGLVTEEFDNCNCHALIICTPNTDRVLASFLCYYFRSECGFRQLIQYETGTTLKHLNSGDICFSSVILPPLMEQERIVSFLDSKCQEIDLIIADKQKQIETLAEYRKSLIYEYVTGKKEVI